MATYVGGQRVDLAGGIDDTTTDSLHGKLGPDSEMSDVSFYDFIQKYEAYNNWQRLVTTWEPRSTGGTILFSMSAFAPVEYKIICRCETAPSEDGGTTGNSTLTLRDATPVVDIIASTTATDLAQHELWYDATPTTTRDLTADCIVGPYITTRGGSIQGILGSKALTAGAITVYCWWRPVDGSASMTVGS